MISQEFDFFAPTKLSEALELLARVAPDGRPLAGGMTLVPLMTLGLAQPQAIVSLNHIAELDYVTEERDVLRIGAMTRHRTIEKHPLVGRHCPLLAQAASYIGDRQVRHRGTIGGSLAHADPAADYPPVMLVTEASFKLSSTGGERIVAARDFFRNLLQTDLRTGEILAEIQIPKLGDGFGSAYQRLHRIEGNFPIVNAAAVVQRGFKAARLALGGIANTAVLLDVAGHLKSGLADTTLEKIAEQADAAARDAPEDLNGNTAYRQALARVYAQRAIKAAAAKIQ